MALAPGTHLGRYEIRSPLGAGGMGEVYLAQDTTLRRPVAVKLLPAEFAANQDLLHRFEREAHAASALNHPNILTVYEIGAKDGLHFIAAEFVDGESLRRRIERAPLELREVLDIGIQISSALATAHEAGIVHRDIKPENVMLRPDGLVKVLDFGLAKFSEQQPPAPDAEAPTRALIKTAPGAVLGTTYYMSPEQARGLVLDARTDIWSLGVVLYELITGQLPFAGETASDVIAAILKTELSLLTRHAPDAPAELERIVDKALRKDREERYQAVKDLGLDLKSLKGRLEFAAELERTGTPERGNDARAATTSEQPTIIETTQTVATQTGGAAATGDLHTTSSAEYIAGEIKRHKLGVAAGLVLLLAAVGFGYWFFSNRAANNAPIESIAVLPFVNESGDADAEYLSDGMTESLIGSLSQLPKLSVKARSSVFRYKGKDASPQTVGNDLSVQAVLLGRVIQRGELLRLGLELVDVRTENVIWSEQYNRRQTDLVSLQSEIARDVSNKLRVRLSGADEQKLAKNYTANAEAYQLYLKGRYHLLKTTRSEFQKAISYFQQAIEIDPSYALAYTGLADAYRSLALAGEMTPTEVFPKAKAAAQKAIEIDDALADAHAAFGWIIFWYDWDWNAAENQYKRALELDLNNADTHLFYAHLLSSTGRRAEGLAEVERARELDPLNLRTNALEGQFLIHAGQTDEALARLQKTFELDANYWLTHSFTASAYIEKGMFSEAVTAARKARELSGVSTQPIAFLGYALAKSGNRAEARAEIEGLLKLSAERYVSPYSIAMIYNGLGERDETLAWLERGVEQRDPRMTFLKVEPKWNNLRDDPRFTDVLRRVGLR
ncbi:MAG: protein kinase domain-containing protein [Pyrinomonadaceae bacterium]